MNVFPVVMSTVPAMAYTKNGCASVNELWENSGVYSLIGVHITAMSTGQINGCFKVRL
ncbi:hypothetical protein THIOM_000202 [Candidatus Thiomargarita nelsonii]|uniref:Uncharacterized protein n=1 Tax=Candidatus Thiomargarita nelsonii TaxID=1003181 RepID=A0A176S760_9GAMM|nr:hypothetical protein THIOM_000202 [Candidatus Thiomargarita nelsonii]